MNNENKKLDELFENLENQWDIHELDTQHFNRFSQKLALKKRKRNFGRFYAIAASVVVYWELHYFILKQIPIKSSNLRLKKLSKPILFSLF